MITVWPFKLFSVSLLYERGDAGGAAALATPPVPAKHKVYAELRQAILFLASRVVQLVQSPYLLCLGRVCMPPQQSQRSYTVKFKLTAVEYALENGNRAARRCFGVSEKMVRDWQRSEEKLHAMKSTKKADQEMKARWSELEARLLAWVLEQCAEGRGLSTVQLRLKAHTLAKEMEVVGFASGPSWCFRFIRCNCLTIRACTILCQKLPEDFAEKLENFKAFVMKQEDKNEILEDHIVNMDEIPLTFDVQMPWEEPLHKRAASLCCCEQQGQKSRILRSSLLAARTG